MAHILLAMHMMQIVYFCQAVTFITGIKANMTIPSLLKTNAVIFDDHKLFAISFSSFIERMGVYESIHTFFNEKELIQFLIAHHRAPVHLFIDFYLEDKTSLLLIGYVKRVVQKIKIIIVSSVVNPVDIQKILSHQPDGLISKSADFISVQDCIKK